MNFRHAAIVLGAGASKGAKISLGRTPPLDAEFLSAAADYFAGKKARGANRARVKAWKEFKTHLKSARLEFSEVKHWRLEQLSTFLEARASLRGLQLAQGRPRDYAQALEQLKEVVCHVLAVEGGTRPCDLHKALFQAIRPGVVISFNYDLIADQSLLELGLLNWRSAEYRCARHASIIKQNGRSQFSLISPRAAPDAVPLLKLHGSMHYEKLRRGTGFRLSGVSLPGSGNELFGYLKVPGSPYIIPPVAAKIEIKQLELRERWYSALDHLHDAPSWIIWGYSFPVTDTISQVLFRTALERNRKPKPVIVVNPDHSVVQRVKQVCQKVRIAYYPSMERFLMDHDALKTQ